MNRTQTEFVEEWKSKYKDLLMECFDFEVVDEDNDVLLQFAYLLSICSTGNPWIWITSLKI
jgi:hypothetical protein